jgi:hypothetical protein
MTRLPETGCVLRRNYGNSKSIRFPLALRLAIGGQQRTGSQQES